MSTPAQSIQTQEFDEFDHPILGKLTPSLPRRLTLQVLRVDAASANRRARAANSYPLSADSSTTTDFGNSSRPASKTVSSTATCSKLWAHAGQVSRMTVETGSFFPPIRQMRRKLSEHLGQVATAKATLPILPRIGAGWW